MDYLGTLTVTVPPSATEGDGVLTNARRYGLSRAVVDLNVPLTNSDTNEVTVTNRVIIPAMQTSATFDVKVEDESRNWTALRPPPFTSAPGYVSGTNTITVHDNETATLSLTGLPPTATEGQGAITGRVDVSTAPAVPVEVSLTSSDTNEVIVPAKVTVAAGQLSSTNFNVTIVNDTKRVFLTEQRQ